MRMRSPVITMLVATAMLAACADHTTAPVPEVRFNQADGGDTYLVRFKNNGVPANFESRVFKLGGEVIFVHAGAGIAAVAGLAPAAADAIAALPGVAAVDADAYTTLEMPAIEGVLDASSVESPANPATAAFWGRQQWNMTAIQAHTAWGAELRGSSSVKVGILDTGIDYLHPDLVGRVDLDLSRSFLSAAENARVPVGAHPVADLHYHGTHVAATVASNAWLGAGVSANVTLVGLKVCAPGSAANGFAGTCPTSGTLAAILYAADAGIPIINMSLGGTFTRKAASARGGDGPSFLATINSVMNYANKRGTIVVVSAGNSAIDMDNDINGYKTYCDAPHVICVSATAPTFGQLFATAQFPAPSGVYLNIQNVDALAGYSNFGGRVMVAAPGGRSNAPLGGSTMPVWAACSGFTIHTGLTSCRTRFYNSAVNWSGSVVGISGTSMASPHVAGVAALVASHVTTGAAQIRARVIESADDLGPAGWDPSYGEGRVNAARALGLQ